MYQSAFVFLSFSVIVIIFIYQDMTRQYLLRTTIRTKVQLFTLMNYRVHDKTNGDNSIDVPYPEILNDSTKSPLFRQNITIDSPTTSRRLYLESVDFQNLSILSNISSNVSRLTKAKVQTHFSIDENSRENNIKINKLLNKLNRSFVMYDTNETRTNDSYYKFNANISKVTSGREDKVIKNNYSDEGQVASMMKIFSLYGKNRNSVRNTNTGTYNSFVRSSCKKFVDDNFNCYLNDLVLETLIRKCRSNKIKKTKFNLDNQFLSRIVQNVSCPMKELEFTKKRQPLVALASFPGSGNTWTRVLLEKATGIHTGSLYKDPKSNFPGSKECPTSGGVFIVKTHRASDSVVRDHCQSSKFPRAMFILRNPYDAIMAEFNRFNGGKVGFATKREFHSKKWRTFANGIAHRWMKTTLFWLTQYKKPLHIIIYESLKANTILEMYKVMNFLKRDISLKSLYCLVNKPQNKYYRGTKPGWMAKSRLFGDKAIDNINRSIYFISQRVTQKSVRQVLQTYLLPLHKYFN